MSYRVLGTDVIVRGKDVMRLGTDVIVRGTDVMRLGTDVMGRDETWYGRDET